MWAERLRCILVLVGGAGMTIVVEADEAAFSVDWRHKGDRQRGAVQGRRPADPSRGRVLESGSSAADIALWRQVRRGTWVAGLLSGGPPCQPWRHPLCRRAWARSAPRHTV